MTAARKPQLHKLGTLACDRNMMISSEEMNVAAKRAAALVGGKTAPFSFNYGGVSSAAFIGDWKRAATSKKLDARREERVVTYADPATGLRVRCAAVLYKDFPVVEWTVWLKNAGKSDTPIIENLQALDAVFACGDLGGHGAGAAPVKLHCNIGSLDTPDDYRPLVHELAPGRGKKLATSGGRPCNAHMPFFNLEWDGAGIIAAIGWHGQWAAEFQHAKTGRLRIVAGQERTHFVLQPGEEVRTPLIALLFYQGGRERSQNLWRRWLVAHNLPRPGGKLPAPMLSALAWCYFAPYGIGNAQTMKVFIDTYEARRIPLDNWWTDAGWYDCDASLPEHGYSIWTYTGTWKTDRRRFPNGLREVTDHARKKGLKNILWFEVERVKGDTWLAKEHPDWLLPQAAAGMKLLDLGDPAALRWAIKCVSDIIAREGIDIYREDFNMEPLPCWRRNDAMNRQGITEIKHVMGHLALWDALLKRHPGLLIDVCASGGRRNDLESLRRAVPLWRDDHVPVLGADKDAVARRIEANQCFTYGLSSWIPYYGSGAGALNVYQFRSVMGASLAFDFDPRRADIDFALWRKLCAQFKHVAPCFLGDYYPLTDYSLATDAWIAWQFDCPEEGAGLVQAFRREKCADKSITLRLKGLKPDALYAVADLDGDEARHLSGKELMETGLRVATELCPAAPAFHYQLLPAGGRDLPDRRRRLGVRRAM